MAGTTPRGGDAHMDVPLSNFAVSAFSDGTNEFIGDQIFTEVPVDKQSDKYYIIDPSSFLQVPAGNGLRAPRTEAKRVEFTVSSDSYFADNYALAGENGLAELANADRAIMLRENTTRLVVSMLRRLQEIRVANIVTSATNVGSGVLLTGTNKWNDYVNSDPLGCVTSAHAFIRGRTGLLPNTLVIDHDTLQVVSRHPQILDMFKYTAGGMATEQQLREVFKVERILVGKAIKNTAMEGQALSTSNVWGNNALLAHIEMAPSMQTATLGARFGWQSPEYPAMFGVQRTVYDGAGSRKVEVVEAGHYQSEKIIGKDLGYLIANTL